MKTSINKSELMKRAWAYYHSLRAEKLKRAWTVLKTFGECLKQIWASMKIEAEYRSKPSINEIHDRIMLHAYNNGSLAYRPGQYVGD